MSSPAVFPSACIFMEGLLDSFTSMAYVWAAAMVGILIGWIWKPRWASSVLSVVKIKPCDIWSGTVQIRCLRPAFRSANTRCENCASKDLIPPMQTRDISLPDECIVKKTPVTTNFARSAIGEGDLADLHRRLHSRDGGLPWDMMMERSAPGMTYQAWRRDPQDGPTEYRSRTIFEDSTPGLVKDFYWDDEFRSAWDDMLIYTKTLEECVDTGADIAHWVRKVRSSPLSPICNALGLRLSVDSRNISLQTWQFPFFCNDREYILGRRIFEADGTFYCITKAVPYTGVPRREKPLRVDIYYSSWCIRAAESVERKGQMTACEVVFFHAEDMHIPKKIAKIGVRQGMWGCVRKMEPGLRKYIAHRSTGKMLSQNVRLAQLCTRMPPKFFGPITPMEEHQLTPTSREPAENGLANAEQLNSCWKWVIVGGAVVLACTLDRGVLGKAVVFGLARRFGRFNQRLL